MNKATTRVRWVLCLIGALSFSLLVAITNVSSKIKPIQKADDALEGSDQTPSYFRGGGLLPITSAFANLPKIQDLTSSAQTPAVRPAAMSIAEAFPPTNTRSAVMSSPSRTTASPKIHPSNFHVVTYATHPGRDDRFCRKWIYMPIVLPEMTLVLI